MFGLSRYERARKAHPLSAFLPARGVALQGNGTRRKALCRFHDDREPSVSVDVERDLFYCHACTFGGSAVEWLMREAGISKQEAVHRLLQETHDDQVRDRALPKVSRGMAPAHTEAPSLEANGPPSSPGPATGELLDRIAQFYHDDLGRHGTAQAYLAGRGIVDAELVRRFRVGYASGRLLSALPKDEAVIEELVRVGVLARRGGSLREHLSGCLTFPIGSPAAEGPPVSFYGRRVQGEGPQHLYLAGPHRGVWNHEAVRAHDTVLVTEAVIDALSAWTLGFPNTIPLYGTGGLTDEHVELFRNAAESGRLVEIVLALDNDPAGEQGAARLVEVLATRLGIAAPRFSRLRLPTGVKDVNEVLQRGAGTLPKAQEAFAGLVQAREVLRERPPRPRVIVDPDAGAPAREPGPGIHAGNGTAPHAAQIRATVGAQGLELEFPAGPNGTPARHYRVRSAPAVLPDRLRALVRAEVGDAAHLDQLDLYSARARTAFAGKLARLAHLPVDALEAELLAVVGEVERYVAQQADAEADRAGPPPMSAEDRDEALAFLADPRLLDRILADMEDLGYVGEEPNKLIGYLVAVSRKGKEPLSAVVLSQSGAGKSALADTIERLTPPEDVLLFSRLTPQALFYMERRALSHRLVMIEERQGSAAADYPIRVLQSRQSLTQAVPIKDPSTGKIKTAIFTVEGPIAYIETSTQTSVHPENETRAFLLYLEESVEATKRIHEAQRRARRESQQERAARTEAIRRRHHNAQRLLEPVEVRIPFAHLLRFPPDALRTRRDHPRFLNLIAALAFLHQKQRPRQEDARGAYIEATVADYRVAYDLAQVVLGSTLHDLAKPMRAFFESLRSLPAGEEGFTRRDIRRHTNLPDYRVRLMLQELVGLEYVEPIEGKQGQRYRYRLCEDVAEASRILSGLTPPDELEKALATAPGAIAG